MRVAEVAGLRRIGLDEVREAALQDREERKYVVGLDVVGRLVEALGTSFDVLEVAGSVESTYATTYFDLPGHELFAAHAQGRRRRWKCRLRHYELTGAAQVEVKLKGRRGQTVKHALPGPPAEGLDAHERAFVADVVRGAYGHEVPVAGLAPVVVTRCRRVALVARDRSARVTLDLDVALGPGALREDLAIVEVKANRAHTPADVLLRAEGHRAVGGCSKFCLATALAFPHLARRVDARMLRRTTPGTPVAPVGVALAA
jgi:hypothetical protein